MPARKQAQEASIAEMNPAVIAAVVIADLAQIEADASTHPDLNAQGRIIHAVSRLREIAQMEVSDNLISQMAQIQQVLFPASE